MGTVCPTHLIEFYDKLIYEPKPRYTLVGYLVSVRAYPMITSRENHYEIHHKWMITGTQPTVSPDLQNMLHQETHAGDAQPAA